MGYNSFCAGVAKLADALDLGSSALGVQVQLLSPAPIYEYERLSRFFLCETIFKMYIKIM
jgi:hypothetical protein